MMEAPHPTGMKGARRQTRGLIRVMVIMGVFLLLVQINRTGGAVLATALADIHGLAPATIGLVTGAMFLASAAVQLPVGLMLDRFGPRRMITSLGFLAVAGMILFAVSDDALGLTAARLLIGVGHGASITGVYLLVVAWAPPERVASLAASVIALAGGFGGLLSTAPLALALQRFGFTETFLALAVVSALIIVVIWIFVEDRPAGTTNTRPRESLGEALRGLVEVIGNRDLRPIFVMALCFSAPFATIGGLWAGPYLRDIHGFNPASAGAIILVMVLCLNLGTFAYGPLDRVFSSRKRIVLGGVAIMTTALLLLAGIPDLPLFAAIGLFAIFSIASPIFVTLAAHCRNFVPEHRAGRAIAVVNLVGVGFIFLLQGVSGGIINALAPNGAPSEFEYRLVFGLVAATLVVTGGIYALHAREAPRREAE
jgi:predicted MFS family arabinose efflux permease